jgi:hypothetical protein
MDKFDLEQAILMAWHTSDDLRLVIEYITEQNLSTDQILNMLIGLAGLHDLRCEKTVNVFERLINERKI